jgi:outer membrane receptor protein involved in Fe transport
MRTIATFFFLLIFAVAGWSQKAAVSGRVLDEATRQPLSGATVLLGDGGQGAVTADNGVFVIRQLEAGKSYNLQVVYLGYEPYAQQAVAGESVEGDITILLKRSNIDLSAVTIQAYGAHRNQVVSRLDIRLRPILNSQEILRMVPGLFMGQHAGGGKAEQIFLRGFDIDHGTDIQLTVDGMPVNMVSHAHGQGYADLHFIIPELVERVDFEKGPYRADKGNFVTAGWVDFRTRERLERSFVKAEVGQYGTARGVLGLNLLGQAARDRNQSAYVAAEYSYSDSYFDAPQYFNRVNVQGRYSGDLSKRTRMTLTASHFWSRWNHSGQIPDRAVESGLISFYGSIDPSEGGETSRSNLNAQWMTQTGNGGLLKNQVFFSRYDFELFSNFTFFLEDPVNGDQIRQREGRNLFGYNGSYAIPSRLGGVNGRSIVGVQYRQDQVRDVELANTRNRTITEQQLQFGDVDEVNAALFVSQELSFSRYFSAELGLRYDHFFNSYVDKLMDNMRREANAGIVSPKINLSYTPNESHQLYLNTGRGFHSNDTRVVVPQNGRDILPAAYGADLGWNWKPTPRLFVNTALWYLWLDQEFVYVGDAGVVEPSGKTRRYGFDLAARYQLTDWLFADVDVNWTDPRSVEDPAGENYIPLAPTFTTVGGLTMSGLKGFSGSLRYRYLANRPANEDNSIVAEGYFVTDLQLNYARKRWELGLNIQNIANTEWKETQFATESRLFDEAEPVEEIHFTPGTPFFARLAFTLYF